ncbi:hypothetical protein ACOME3_004684 [Neoechinorhynchus agilis]
MQFLANGLQPSISQEDKEYYEKLFDFKVKIFLNSRRSGLLIPTAMVKSSRPVRDELCDKNLKNIGLGTKRKNSRLMNRVRGPVPASTTSSSAAFSIGTASGKTNTIYNPPVPTSQLVIMDWLERRLEETCEKLLSIMQARFAEAIMVFERKICALIGNLANLPDLISSVISEPNSSALKRSNSEEPNIKASPEFDCFITAPFGHSSQGLISIFNFSLNATLISSFGSNELSYSL